MKYCLSFFLLLNALLTAWSQPYPEFSPLSGRAMNYFSSVKVADDYFYQLTIPPDGIRMYRVSENGEILDSTAVPNSLGSLVPADDRLFFAGVDWNGSVFTTMREVFIEFDTDLNTLQQVGGVPLQPIHAPITLEQTAAIVNTLSGGFSLYNDTLFSFQKYLVVDSPQVFLGTVNIYSKTGTDGTVYADFPLNINGLYNCFFVQNRLYVQGSGDVSPFNPKALLEFDSDGNLVQGIDYDAYGSGQFLDGALGGWYKDRFYFTYLGYDPTLSGCSENNATIDVRDSDWNDLYRFKLPDCGYLVSGKMPFGFDAQDNVFYAAPHLSYKKIMVYKFTPDFQLLWQTELNFEDQTELFYPLSQLPTADGGILLNCQRALNGAETLMIFKISASGEVISSTQVAGWENEKSGPMTYPNPTSGLVFLAPEYAGATLVQISTPDGRFLGAFDTAAGQIDLSSYPSGPYLVSLWDANQKRFLGTEVVIKR